jgi:hypothetical protein
MLDGHREQRQQDEQRGQRVEGRLRGPVGHGAAARLGLAQRGPRRGAVPAEEVQVRAQQHEEHQRQHHGVQREEAREAEVADVVAAQEQPRLELAHHRRAAHDAHADLGGPVGVLVVGQQVAGEREGRHHREQQHTGQPRGLARRAVGAPHDDPQAGAAPSRSRRPSGRAGGARAAADPAGSRARCRRWRPRRRWSSASRTPRARRRWRAGPGTAPAWSCPARSPTRGRRSRARRSRRAGACGSRCDRRSRRAGVWRLTPAPARRGRS